MKLEKSTAACKAFNEQNAEPISLGLMEAQEPNDHVLKEEEKESGFIVIKKQKEAFFRAVSAALIEAGITAYKLDKAIEGIYKSQGYQSVDLAPETYSGRAIKLESYASSRYSYGLNHDYWRVVIGGYGNTKLFKVGKQLEVLPAVVAKIVAEIKSRIAEEISKAEFRVRQQQAEDVRKAVFAANQDTFKALGISYESSIRVSERDGIQFITSGNVALSLTIGQWNQVAALIASFKK